MIKRDEDGKFIETGCRKGHKSNKKSKSGACHECYQEYHRQWAKEFRLRMRDHVHAYKLSLGCAHCGYKENAWALEFDHMIPVRKARADTPWQFKTYTQFEKFVSDPNIQVLCANCHRIKTRLNGDFKRRVE